MRVINIKSLELFWFQGAVITEEATEDNFAKGTIGIFFTYYWGA